MNPEPILEDDMSTSIEPLISDFPNPQVEYLRAAANLLGLELASFDGCVYRRNNLDWDKLDAPQLEELTRELLAVGVTISGRGIAKPLPNNTAAVEVVTKTVLSAFARKPELSVVALNGRLVDLRDVRRRVPSATFFLTSLSGTEDPTELNAWLTSVVGEHRQALLEALAWALLGDGEDFDTQAVVLLYGASRAGKGTMLRLFQAVAGPAAGIINSDWDNAFRFGKLGHCSCAISAEYFPQRETGEFHSDILTFGAGEPITINDKNVKPFVRPVAPRLILAANDRGFRDPVAGAMSGRLQTILFPHSHAGSPDNELFHRLKASAPALALLLAGAWQEFLKRKKFLRPNQETTLAAGVFGDGLLLTSLLEHCEVAPDCPDWQCPTPAQLKTVLDESLKQGGFTKGLPIASLLKTLERKGVKQTRVRYKHHPRRRVVLGLRPLPVAELESDSPWKVLGILATHEGRLVFGPAPDASSGETPEIDGV